MTNTKLQKPRWNCAFTFAASLDLDTDEPESLPSEEIPKLAAKLRKAMILRLLDLDDDELVLDACDFYDFHEND